MPRRFKDPLIQAAYGQCRSMAPEVRGGIGNAYWKGREHPEAKSPFPRNSVSYGAWAAGVDDARAAAKRTA